MKKKECIAMLLAGGQGTRLFSLTSKVAKPAVSFGSKYRIIDFTLSNCSNSGITTVGVLTQYQPLILTEYIGSGEPWDLDRADGGVHVLPPYQAKKGGEWYKGTANAIYQNLHFLSKYDSEHVLILSGDHIYKMDYSAMLREHIRSHADCTIAVIDVPQEDASRFGIMDYDEDGLITSFEEKPKEPKSNHASMGVYIFRKDVLVSELVEDEKDELSSNDFGKNIIPTMLKKGYRMFAYEFDGYWKDVGTIGSLWEANKDLLDGRLELSDPTFKIYSRNEPLPPCFIGEEGEVVNSLVTSGCEIYGTVINSVLSEKVTVAEGAVVENSIIMRGTIIGQNASLRYAIVDEDVTIGDGVEIGDEQSCKQRITLIGRGTEVEDAAVVESGAILEKEDRDE